MLLLYSFKEELWDVGESERLLSCNVTRMHVMFNQSVCGLSYKINALRGWV